MSQIQYKTLSTITLKHAYYANGLSAGIDLVPTRITQKTLADHRWLFKPNAYGGTLVFAAKPHGQPCIEANNEVTLTFLMQLNNPGFMNFTQLPPIANPDEIYRFANGVNNNELTTVKMHSNRANPFGILEIKDTFNFEKPESYDFQFCAKSLAWTYIIVLENDYTGASFAIEDQGTDHGPYPSPMLFTQTRGSTAAYAKGNRLVFTSGTGTAPDVEPQLIPYYELPKKQLQLTIDNPTGDDTTLNNLANPSVEYPKPEMYIYV